MTEKTFRPWDVDQQMLFPPSVKDLVPRDHLVHFLRDLVREELDLSAIYSRYTEGRGYPPYRLRKQVVEPVFGQIKEARGFRQFLHRGLENVRRDWSVVCTVHNLLKLFKKRSQRSKRRDRAPLR